MSNNFIYSMHDAFEIAQMIISTRKKIHHTELFAMIYGKEIPASMRKEKILNVMQYASKQGFNTYYEDGYYILIEKEEKETPKFSWNNNCLLRWVEVNGIGGINALWGR